MSMSNLLLIAVAPAVILMIYVYKKDKSKEPIGMLLKLVLLGAISCVPAAGLERLLEGPIKELFGGSGYLYNFIDAFFGVALIEEGCKFIFLYLYTHNHKEFDSLFDGMVYAIFVSLGFAALENIGYVTEYGASAGFSRALTAVPAHMFFAVFMGYYYSLWHTYRLCDKSEKYFANLGMITIKPPKYKYDGYLARAVIMPVLVHGFYDFCLFTKENALLPVFYVFVIFLYIFCFSRIKKLSKQDIADYKLIPLMLCRKYPELIGIIMPGESNPTNMSDTYYRNQYDNQNNNIYYSQNNGYYNDPYNSQNNGYNNGYNGQYNDPYNSQYNGYNNGNSGQYNDPYNNQYNGYNNGCGNAYNGQNNDPYNNNYPNQYGGQYNNDEQNMYR